MDKPAFRHYALGFRVKALIVAWRPAAVEDKATQTTREGEAKTNQEHEGRAARELAERAARNAAQRAANERPKLNTPKAPRARETNAKHEADRKEKIKKGLLIPDDADPKELIGKNCVAVADGRTFKTADDCWNKRTSASTWAIEKGQRLTIMDAKFKQGFVERAWLLEVKEHKGSKKSKRGWIWAHDVRMGR